MFSFQCQYIALYSKVSNKRTGPNNCTGGKFVNMNKHAGQNKHTGAKLLAQKYNLLWI